MKLVKGKFWALILGAILFVLIPAGIIWATGDIPTINLHIKVEASKDQGATWYNYSGADYSGGQTLSANPGDTIWIRIKLWNDGEEAAGSIAGTGAISNYSYVSSATVLDADKDEDTIPYDGYFFTGTGTGNIGVVLNGTSETFHAEQLLLAIKLSDVAPPEGSNIILGEATISAYDELHPVKIPWVERALAAGLNRKSAVRIAINTSQTTSTPTPTPTPTSTENLPETGAAPGGWAGLVAILVLASFIFVYQFSRSEK